MKLWLCLLLLSWTLTSVVAEEVRAARSVHFGYLAPDGDLFYNEMVIEQSANGSYFMAAGWNTGYLGLQQLNPSAEKLVIFSVWDPTKGDPSAAPTEDRVEVLYEGEGVQVQRLAGEGTGRQCLAPFPWTLGGTNRFLLRSEGQGQKTAFTAWIGETNGPGWRKLATFRTRNAGRPLSGYYSFMEDLRRDGASAREVRRARFGNGWVRTRNGDWTSLTRARFTASGTEGEAQDSINAGIDAGWFYLVTGGETVQSFGLRKVLERMPSSVSLPDLTPTSRHP